MSRINSIQSAISGITTEIASIQQIIAQLQAELGTLEPPDPGKFKKTERRYDGSQLRDVQVFDSAAFNAAMSKYLSQVNELQSKIQAQQSALAQKESQLAQKQQELSQAQQDLNSAQQELEKALANDRKALEEAQKRFREQQEKALKAQQAALKAQAEAQKAQEDLAKSQQELQKTKESALKLGGYTPDQAKKLDEDLKKWDPKSSAPPPYQVKKEPSSDAVSKYNKEAGDAHRASKDALRTAANELPTVRNGQVLPPAHELSARDYIDVVGNLASYEKGGLHAQDAGLLTNFDPQSDGPVTPQMRQQMVSAWQAAGFTPDQIKTGLENVGLCADPVAQAKADYAKIKQDAQRDPKTDQACQDFTNQLAAHSKDPAYQAAMIEQAKNDTHLNLLSTDNLMSPGGNGIFSRNLANGDYSGHFTDEQRNAFTASMKAARDAGVYKDDEIKKLASESKDPAAAAPFAWQELANRVGIQGVPPSPTMVLAASTSVGKAQSAYDNAKKDKENAQKELEAQMAGFNSALKPEQRQAYIEAYWRDHKDVTDAYDNAAKKLDETLSTEGPILEAAAAGKPPNKEAADKLYKGYVSLTESPYARHAMDFVARANTTPGLKDAFKGKDLEEDIFGPASVTVSGQILADPNLDPETALTKLKELYEPYADKIADVTTIVSDIFDLNALYNHAYTPEAFAKKISDFENGKLGKTASAVGAMWGFLACYRDSKSGDGVKAVGDLARALRGSSDILAKSLGAYARGGSLLAEDAELASKTLNKFVPFLGTLASATSAAVDIRAAMKDGNAGDWLNVAGDVLSFAGSCMACTGALAPVGEAVLLAGTMVSAVGVFVSNAIDGDKVRDEQKKFLKAAGLDDHMIDTLIKADAEQTQALAAMGLSPEQIQQLAGRCGQLVQSHHGWGPYLGNLKKISADAGLSGTDVFEMLSAADQGAETSGEGTWMVAQLFANNTQGAVIAGSMESMRQNGASKQDLKRHLLQELRGQVKEVASNPEFQRALRQATDSLAA